jgi:hypothetical protein
MAPRTPARPIRFRVDHACTICPDEFARDDPALAGPVGSGAGRFGRQIAQSTGLDSRS